MQVKSSDTTRPVVAYSTLVGKVLADLRDARKLRQGDLAQVLGVSQSAYSRMESGDSIMNVTQLRVTCARLRVSPSDVLKRADGFEAQLRRQGVDVASEKPDNSPAIAIGLGLLAALFLSSK